jgi:epoxyqueuosine reductase
MKLVLTDGRRTLAPIALAENDPIERAYQVMQERYGLERFQANFVAVRASGKIVFRVSPEISREWLRVPVPPRGEAKADILACARALGFVLAGVTTPKLPERYSDRFDAWLAGGNAAGMDFLARKAAERRDPELVLRGAKSVIALATTYSPDDASDSRARIARYAQSRDYHDVIERRLKVLASFIEREHQTRCYLSVDTGPVLERAYAERAGLGWIGKNGVLISRSHGSYLFLSTVWTQLELTPDAPHVEHCGSCDACMTGCPTGAITAPGLVDARACISYWTIEHKGELDAAPPQHGWLFGCDVCQEVCPWNRFSTQPTVDELAQKKQFLGPPEAWTDDTYISASIAQSPLRRAEASGLKRNAKRLKVLP